jgi:hypothetical protein
MFAYKKPDKSEKLMSEKWSGNGKQNLLNE